jgi:hypothetical protein
MEVPNLSDEDAQSLIEPSISHVASRLKSPKTPSAEKTAAIEDLGGVFDSDPESPPATPGEGISPTGTVKLGGPFKEESQHSTQKKGLSLGTLPSPRIEDSGLPITPWRAGPKQLTIQPSAANRSSLYGVFDNKRSRSRSGGAEALKKFLPKGLPSMAQVGNLFGSSNTSQKPRVGGSSSLQGDFDYPRSGQSGSSSVSGGSPASDSPRQQAFDPIVLSRRQVSSRNATSAGPRRPAVIRRVTSDDSLLYHSLSRASSLGDDTRFENHREQVNSRVKAIRDSLQDRSSFRMPQMPSMSYVPSFSFSINFLNANVPARWRSDTDVVTDILPGTLTKKRSTPGVAGASISMPKTAIEAARGLPEGQNTSFLDHAMESLTGDVVIMGGYRGSILRKAKPPHRQLWVPVKVGLNIRKVDLEVGLDPEDEERMEESIFASGMLQNIGPVDISKRLFKRLSECENARNGKLRVWDYGYDWRLSPHLLSRKLTAFLEKLPSNQPGNGEKGGALVVAHSLGGVITRHVVNHRPELFSGVVYAGAPQSCVNILGPIRNGDAVLLSSRVLTAQVNFTLRTSFVLLPENGDCFFDINTKEKYLVDFFNLDDWIKYRWSPCTDPPLPPRNQTTGGLGSLLNMSGSLLSLPVPGKKSISGYALPQTSALSPSSEADQSMQPTEISTKNTRPADVLRQANDGTDQTLAPQMGNNSNPISKGQSTNTSVSTTVTIPRDKAVAYLGRTLAEIKKFKLELHFRPELSESNRYPPLAVIYGKSIPTVFGAKVDGREGIPCLDVYDNLAFASGDGVVLAREAMLPEGYKTVYGGRISTDRGHVTLLGDLNAVGRAIEAVSKGRSKGIGLGESHKGVT